MTVITREQWVVLLHKKLISGGYGCKKTVKNGDKFHGDKRQEQQVNDIKVRFTFLQSGLYCSYYFNYPSIFYAISVFRREQLLFLPFFSLLCKGLPFTTSAAMSPKISRTCKIFTWNTSIIASESAGEYRNLHQLPKTNGKHLALTSILWLQRPHVSLQVERIVQ